MAYVLWVKPGGMRSSHVPLDLLEWPILQTNTPMLLGASVIPQLALSLMPPLCHMLVAGIWNDADGGATQEKFQPDDSQRGLLSSPLQGLCFLPSVLGEAFEDLF